MAYFTHSALLCAQEPSLLERHLARVAVDQEIILTQISCGYLKFALNWIAYIDGLGITNWLTIAEDQAALIFLEKKHPGHVLPSSAFINGDLSETLHFMEYGTAAFAKLACARPQYLQVSVAKLLLYMGMTYAPQDCPPQLSWHRH